MDKTARRQRSVNILKPFLCLLLLALISQGSGPISAARAEAGSLPRQTSQTAETWLPGLYTGWVYFLARSDLDYFYSGEGAQVEFAATLFHESHGTIDCSVLDAAGNGTCSTSFPLDLTGAGYGTSSMPDCLVTMEENMRAMGIAENFPLSTLVAVPLGEGFSLPFTPTSSPGQGRLQVSATGGAPGCNSQTLQGEFPLGIKWDELDFHVEYHTTITVGGTCSMASFPRQLAVGNSHTTATIEECQWRMFFFDPYAKLPER